jgi:hypothetical protein
MTRWEYCDITWQTTEVTVTRCEANGEPWAESFDTQTWPQLLAKLGDDGWEMVTALVSPAGGHEYFFYFKRPVEE